MKRFFERLILYIFSGFLICLLVWGISNRKLVSYGLDQLRGQLHIVMNTRSLEDVMKDKATPDSLKEKILFIEKVKKFAIDSLGLKTSRNYTTLYDQQNKPILWTLTASDPFKIQ